MPADQDSRRVAVSEVAAAETEPQSVEQPAEISAHDALVRERVEWRRRYELTEQPNYDPKWLPQVREPTPEELARSAEVEAADVAAGLDGWDEVYTDEDGMPLPEYEGLLPDWMIGNLRRDDQARRAVVEPTKARLAAAAELLGEDAAGIPEEAGARYSGPADVYEGIMSGDLTATEARRLFRDLESAPTSEPTTELVRAEKGLDFELGNPAEPPDEDMGLTDEGSTYAKLVDWGKRRETVDDIDEAGDVWGAAIDGLSRDQPQPTGAYVGTEKYPVIHQAPRESVDGGAVLVGPLALWLVVDHYGRPGIAKLNEWRHAKGDRGHAGD